ncbi:Glutathione peroxidase [Hahella chejuensis KCTC 2396]|uniref:Glutathione peroxidase n=1 Tax=Hahella chejuensis (strain KCTC 2396) TaxID=349521 RepID=Q2SPM6_HAHCH|nr:glutathione peroxidase [Hahella chejuensis]ABC27398.1 Glutathione peroxidase [Hahella chejuensis KCTC 2396]
MTTLYDFTLKDIHGADLPLEQFKGRTLLLVNVASECGLTPQYEELQSLYEERKDDGLVVLGLPCNQFGGQEPGDEAAIHEFCSTRFQVSFPMTSKTEVNGPGRSPLYQWLIGDGEDIRWNFEKFLVDGEGRCVARFDPRTPPSDEELLDKIDEQLHLSKILLGK